MKYGIDVSMFVNVDILKYMPDFVMIRGGEGTVFKDAKAEYYARICKDNGIPFGIYWVLDLSTGSGVEHASVCLRAIESLPEYPRMGVWLDCETPYAYDNVAIGEFCQKIEEADFYAGIYTGIMQLRDGTIQNDRYDKWAAYYGTDSGNLSLFTPDEIDIMKEHCTIWQYASGSGTEPDLDVCFLDDLKIFDLKDNDLPQPGAGGGNGLPPEDLLDEKINECLELINDLKDKLNQIKKITEERS